MKHEKLTMYDQVVKVQELFAPYIGNKLRNLEVIISPCDSRSLNYCQGERVNPIPLLTCRKRQLRGDCQHIRGIR